MMLTPTGWYFLGGLFGILCWELSGKIFEEGDKKPRKKSNNRIKNAKKNN